MSGILLAVLAGLCWGVGEVFTRSVLHTRQIGPLTAIAVRSTVALPALWLAYLIGVHWMRAEPARWLKADTSTLLKLIIGSGLIAGAGGMICFYAALNLGEVSRIKPIAFSIAPMVAVILGTTVLDEAMTVQKAVAVVLILAGVVLLTANPGTGAGAGARDLPHASASQATPLN